MNFDFFIVSSIVAGDSIVIKLSIIFWSEFVVTNFVYFYIILSISETILSFDSSKSSDRIKM